MMLARRGFLLTTLAATAGFCASPLAEIELARGRYGLMVDVTIEGQTAHMILDTGAGRTVLTQDGRSRLNLPLDPNNSTTLQGAGGQTDTHPNAIVRNMSIGGVQLFARQPREVLSLATAELPYDGVDGLLGSDILRHLTLVIDIQGGHLALLPNGSCSASYDDVRLQLLQQILPMAEVVVDHTSLLAIIDTGASNTQINGRGMQKLILSAQAMSDDPSLSALVVGGQLTVRSHPFANLQIGPIRLEQPTLLVSAATAGPFDMLLGRDVLARQAFTLSYGTQSLAFG
jgi:predicted aspartyl protease